MNKKYDLLVFIGRFQPLHKGHQEVIERAIELSERVLVLVGSANQARSTRNPFTYEERAKLITDIYPNVITRPLHDHTYNDTAWIMEVQENVKHVLLQGETWQPNGLKDFNVGLIGCNKDHTSYYLKMFPDWANESIEFIDPLSATSIRNHFFEGKLAKRPFAAAVMDTSVYDFLVEFAKTEAFTKLADEHVYLEEYYMDYGNGPFLTADALVQVGGKVLLIKRGKEYGHGLLAMPGGFVNHTETFQSAAIRELREETNLRVPIPVLKGSIRKTFVADDPNRSARARLVSQVYHIVLENDVKLPEIRGGDDADEAMWMDISDLRREDFFEDHFHVIKLMLGLN
jgi:bifunctional NMN adenylyltransferase/nudix hydrolase